MQVMNIIVERYVTDVNFLESLPVKNVIGSRYFMLVSAQNNDKQISILGCDCSQNWARYTVSLCHNTDNGNKHGTQYIVDWIQIQVYNWL